MLCVCVCVCVCDLNSCVFVSSLMSWIKTGIFKEINSYTCVWTQMTEKKLYLQINNEYKGIYQ